MARGYGFMAVACWCALSTAASAQYPPAGGQPTQNPALLPSSEYFTAVGSGGPPAPPAAPQLAPALPWGAPAAVAQQPRIANSAQPVMPQPQPLPSDQIAPVPNPTDPSAYNGNTVVGDWCPNGCGNGWLSNNLNGYGVPVYGGMNQFNFCCPCQSPCASGACNTGMGGAGMGNVGMSGWGSGVNSAAPCGSPFSSAINGCGESLCGPWYGGVAALFLWRAGGNRTWLTYNENNNNDQLLNTQMANSNFYGGQITIGRYLGCNHAIEATYWGVATSTGSVGLTDPNNKLGTPLDEQGMVGFGPGSGFTPFDGSHQQEIIRQDNIQNAELNFLTFPMAFSPTTRFRVALLGGVRYFRFQDALTYGGTEYGTTWGQNGGADEAFLNVRTTNNLLGTQIGTRMSYFVTPRFSLFATPKFGLYSNFMGVNASLYSGSGQEFFNVSNRSTSFAALAEVDLGGNFYITPRLSVYAAYRLIGVSGVATADTQIPPYLVDTAGFSQLNHNDALILQGVMTGVMYNF